MQKFDVLVQGVVSADVIFSSIPRMPKPGEEVYCGAFEFTGGAAYITAVALARLGLKVAILAPIGTDFLSQFLVKSLKDEGVSTHLMKELNQPLRTLSVAINFGGDRSFLSYQDQVKGFRLDLYTKEILKSTTASILHMSGSPESIPLIQLAKEKGMEVVLDIGWDEQWLIDPRLRKIIKQSDYFMPNLKEALYITGEQTAEKALYKLREWCPDTKVIIKLGEEGAFAEINGKNVTIQGYKKRAIDTTGAGDVFAAGVITGLHKGYSMEESIRLGNFCGACSVEGLGGATTSPDWTRVENEFFGMEEKL